jgi:hypothetical protein
MKRTALALFHIAICYNVLGQTDTSFAGTDLSKMATQKDVYMQKSRVQKTAAFVMLGIGTATMITGSAIMRSAKKPLDKETFNGAGLIFIGMVIDFCSIPFFISSSKSKEKAMSLAIKNEPIPKEMFAQVKQKSVPSFSVKWKF